MLAAALGWDELESLPWVGLGREGYGASLHLGISPALKEEGSKQPGGYPGDWAKRGGSFSYFSGCQ